MRLVHAHTAEPELIADHHLAQVANLYRRIVADRKHGIPDIVERATPELLAAFKEHGMMTLAEAAARKVIRGITSFAEVEHLLTPPAKAHPAYEPTPWTRESDATSATNQHATPTGPDEIHTTDEENIIDIEFTEVSSQEVRDEECVLTN